MHTLRINKLVIYGYHGVLEEERQIGGNYQVDVVLSGDFTQACIHDDLRGTVDYSAVCSLIKEEFTQPSLLIEHLAKRILDSISTLAKNVQVEVTVTKLNPPVIPTPHSVSITLKA